MRLSNTQAVARPTYYDRNPINRTQYSNTNAIAPHGVTTRWSYTVPAGKKAFVDALFTVVRRATAATAADICESYIRHTPSGGATSIIAYSGMLSNVVGALDKVNTGGLGALLPGDVIDGTDDDNSTGGTVLYIQSSKVFEFDA